MSSPSLSLLQPVVSLKDKDQGNHILGQTPPGGQQQQQTTAGKKVAGVKDGSTNGDSLTLRAASDTHQTGGRKGGDSTSQTHAKGEWYSSGVLY